MPFSHDVRSVSVLHTRHVNLVMNNIHDNNASHNHASASRYAFCSFGFFSLIRANSNCDLGSEGMRGADSKNCFIKLCGKKNEKDNGQ